MKQSLANSGNKKGVVVETSWAARGKPELDPLWLYLKARGTKKSLNNMTGLVFSTVLSDRKNESTNKWGGGKMRNSSVEDFHRRMWKLNSFILDFSLCMYIFWD